MTLSRLEQETIINFNAAEQTAMVYTRDKTVMRRLNALAEDYPDIYRLTSGTDIDKTYSVPKSYITYRKPRNLTDGQREQARKRMAALNSTIVIEKNSKNDKKVLTIKEL